MRIGVKVQPAREALQRCVTSNRAVNHYYNALLLVRQALIAGLSLDPYGNSIWSPRISSRISKCRCLDIPCPVCLSVFVCITLLYYSTVCTEITIQSLKRQTYYLLYNVITTIAYITPVFRELDAQCIGR